MSPRRPPRSSWQRLAHKGPFGRVTRFASRDVWHLDVGTLPRFAAALIHVARVCLIAARGFVRDRCMQQAAALTYLTIFSLPALLALAFSVAKGFKAYEKLKEGPIDAFLDHAFPVESGEGAVKIREVVDTIFAYVQNADLTALTTVGIVFLVYATVQMLGAIERAFNEIWGVQRARSFVRKLSDYLAIVVVAPVAMLVGTAFTGFLHTRKALLLGSGVEFSLGWLAASVPILAICLGMTLVLLMLPNTRVRLFPALVGGVVAGILWQIGQLAFIEFQMGLARLNAIFSTFAAVPLLLSWIYFSWVTLFIGAEVTFAVQNEAVMTSIVRTGVIDQRFREAVAPRLAGRIAAAFLGGQPPPTVASLTGELGIGPRAVMQVLEPLVQWRLLVRSSEDSEEEGYLPARDPDTITVLDLIQAMRVVEEACSIPTRNRLDERVDRILAGFDEAMRTSLHNYTLSELAKTMLEKEEAPAPAEAAGMEARVTPDSPG